MKHRRRTLKLGESALLLTIGCGTVVGGSHTSYAEQGVVTLSADLSTANEVPPLTPENIEATATGKGVVVLSQSGRGEAKATLKFVLCNIPRSSITFVKVDVHEGSAGTRGPIAIDTSAQRNHPLTVAIRGGCARMTLDGFATAGHDLSTVVDEIIAEPSGFYFELHTVSNDYGLVRGQLVRE